MVGESHLKLRDAYDSLAATHDITLLLVDDYTSIRGSRDRQAVSLKRQKIRPLTEQEVETEQSLDLFIDDR